MQPRDFYYYAESALAIWMERDQIPIPSKAKGHPRVMTVKGPYAPKPSRGLEGHCIVKVSWKSEGDDVPVDYDVAWYGAPAQYRLVSAVDTSSDLRLDLFDVDEITQVETERQIWYGIRRPKAILNPDS